MTFSSTMQFWKNNLHIAYTLNKISKRRNSTALLQLKSTPVADIQPEMSNNFFSKPLKLKEKRHFNIKSQYSFATVYSAVRIFLLEKSKGSINLSQFLTVFYGHFGHNLWGLGATYSSLQTSTRKIQLNALHENPIHTTVKKQQEPNSTYMGPWRFSRAEGFYLSTFSYCNYSNQVRYTSFPSIAPTLLDLECLESCLSSC